MLKRKIIAFLLTVSYLTTNTLSVYASADMESVSFVSEQQEYDSEETKDTIISENAVISEEVEEIDFNMPKLNEYSNAGEIKDISEIDISIAEETLDAAGATDDYLPSKYDGRIYCSSIKTQLGGTCWAYAELAAMESSLIKSGYASSEIDLSELQHIYYFYNKVYDPLENINNDYNSAISNNVETNNFAIISQSGGNNFYSAFRVANGGGMCLESELPYTSTDSDVTVDNKYCFKNDIAHIKNIYFCTFSPSNVKKIKKMITNYGGVAAAYYTYNSSNYYRISNGTSSYYYPESVNFVNHAIEVVGWDDNYSASNFVQTPKGNGAWLCKNSWGTTNYLNADENPVDGYFWLSYYDTTYQQGISIASAYEFEDISTYDNLYQYDGSSKPNSYNGKKAYMNVFTAKGEGIQKIEAVSVGISSSNASYYAKVYTNPVICDNKIISYDSSSSSISKTITQPGIYKTELTTDLYVSQGDTFAVVITMVNPNSYIFGSTTTSSGWANFYDNMEENQSFYGVANGTDVFFYDLSSSETPYTPCIKVMTSDTNIPLSSSTTIMDNSKTEMYVGDEMTLSAVVLPSNALQKVIWSSSNETVATIDENGTITALEAGTCKMRATAADNKSCSEITITVKKLAEEISIAYGYDNIVYLAKGKSETLFCCIYPEDATDNSIIWSSSDESVVNVNNGIITGCKEGTAIITALNKESNLSDTITIAVINPTTNIDFHVENTDINNNQITLFTNDSTNNVSVLATANGSNKGLSVQISDPSVISYDNMTGTLKGIKNGTATIIFTGKQESSSSIFLENGKIKAGTPFSKTLTVSVKTKVEEIQLETYEITMNTEQTKTLNFIVTPSNASIDEICFESSNTDIAEVTKDGQIIAKKRGNCIITAKANALNDVIEARCELTVIQPVKNIDVAADIYMNYNDIYTIGEEINISILPNDANNKNLEYNIIGDCIKLDNNKIKALRTGSAIVEIKTTDGSNLTKTVTVHVVKKATYIKTEENLILKDKEVKKLNVQLDPDASIQSILFSSTNETIASVDTNGLVTAKGKPGTCEVIVSTNDGSNLTARCKVTVNISVNNLVLSANKTTLTVGESAQLNCTIIPANATNKNVTYDSSNPCVIYINDNVITAIGKGQAVVTATSADNHKVSQITIEVTEPKIEVPNVEAPNTEQKNETNIQKKEVPVGTVLCDNKNNYYVVENEHEVSYSGTNNRDIKTVVIPASILYEDTEFKVTSIADNALNNCNKLKSVKIGKNIREIGENAFKNCKKLTKISIPNSVTIIKKSAFSGCKSLTKVTIGTGLKSIKTKAFYNCSKLNKITVKSKQLKKVEKNAFKNIKSKATIKVPKEKYKTYKTKTFKNAGLSKTVKFTKG